MINILHIIHDNHFFVSIEDQFKRNAKAVNKYVAIVQDAGVAITHIGDIDLWRVVEKDYVTSSRLADDLAWSDCVVIHGLSVITARIILNTPINKVIAWSGWGADYYAFISKQSNQLIEIQTMRLIQNMEDRGVFGAGIRKIKDVARKCRAIFNNRIFYYPAIERVDIFSAPIRDDFDLLKASLPTRFRCVYAQLNYGSIDDFIPLTQSKQTGDDILVGNSATPTNNHLEVLKVLARIDLGTKQVLMPLSYGDEKYKNSVIKQGYNLLGSHFHPIVEMMSLADYNKYISRCSVVIMNHRRQQALGNICAMLYNGARVYLNEHSPIYKFLKRKGACIFETKILEQCDALVFSRLESRQISINRMIIDEIWGRPAVDKNVCKFIITTEQLLANKRNSNAKKQ